MISVQAARIIAYGNMAEYALSKIAEHAQGPNPHATVIREQVRSAQLCVDEIRDRAVRVDESSTK